MEERGTEKVGTGTAVHAPWKVCGRFEIAAAWDSGASPHFFSCAVSTGTLLAPCS